MPYLSTSEVVFHEEVPLYQVYFPLPVEHDNKHDNSLSDEPTQARPSVPCEKSR